MSHVSYVCLMGGLGMGCALCVSRCGMPAAHTGHMHEDIHTYIRMQALCVSRCGMRERVSSNLASDVLGFFPWGSNLVVRASKGTGKGTSKGTAKGQQRDRQRDRQRNRQRDRQRNHTGTTQAQQGTAQGQREGHSDRNSIGTAKGKHRRGCASKGQVQGTAAI